MLDDTRALAWQRIQSHLAAQSATRVGSLWAQVDPANIVASWDALLPTATATVAQAQLSAMSGAEAYVSQSVADAGLVSAPDGAVSLRSLIDPQGLAQVLRSPAFRTLAHIDAGKSTPDALRMGGGLASAIGSQQTRDAGRDAVTVAMAANPVVVGWVRVLVTPSCGRCAVLAGRVYAWSDGFKRHPHCFPAGVVVSGSGSEAATRRRYEGELVVLSTAHGENLPLTGNHPVLTTRGWLPANLIEEGDEVVRSTRPQGANALEVPDHDQVPALIENVWSSLRMGGLDVVPSTAEDFHGDGQDGEVHVVRADGSLRYGFQPSLSEHFGEGILSTGFELRSGLFAQRAAQTLDLRCLLHSHRPMGGGGLEFALSGGHLGRSEQARLGGAAALDPRVYEDSGYRSSRNVMELGDLGFADSARVLPDDFVGRQGESLSRWDAPGSAFTAENSLVYASKGLDLLQRLSGQVEVDRVVQVRRTSFAGHVFSLTSSEGWHTANNLIVSNCDCQHQIVTKGQQREAFATVNENPRKYFDSLTEADQDKYFGTDQSTAIRDGARVSDAVNTDRGMWRSRYSPSRTTGDLNRHLVDDVVRRSGGDHAKAVAELKRLGYLKDDGRRAVIQSKADRGKRLAVPTP